MTYIVTLDWPSRKLHPNARVHWTVRAAAAKRARTDACILAQIAGVRMLRWPGAKITITFRPPDKRRRDLDGCLSACKSALDGIADATGIDDSRWEIAIARDEPVPGGAVDVEIQPAEAPGMKPQDRPRDLPASDAELRQRMAEQVEALRGRAEKAEAREE